MTVSMIKKIGVALIAIKFLEKPENQSLQTFKGGIFLCNTILWQCLFLVLEMPSEMTVEDTVEIESIIYVFEYLH